MRRSLWYRVVHHPFSAAAAGALLAVTGLVEILESFVGSGPADGFGLRSEHGQSAFGIFLFVRSIGEAFDHLRTAKAGVSEAATALGPKG